MTIQGILKTLRWLLFELHWYAHLVVHCDTTCPPKVVSRGPLASVRLNKGGLVGPFDGRRFPRTELLSPGGAGIVCDLWRICC